MNCCAASRTENCVVLLFVFSALFGAALLFRLSPSLMYTFGSEEVVSFAQWDEEDGSYCFLQSPAFELLLLTLHRIG
jgi:hypothetical protein